MSAAHRMHARVRMRLLSTLVLVVLAAACTEPSTSDDVADGDPSDPARAPVHVPEVDVRRPYVIDVVPRVGAIEIERDATVQATFTADMLPDSLNAESFTLTRDGQPVAGEIAYVTATRTVHFRPSPQLERGGVYQASITEDAVSRSGVSTRAFSWTFSVAARGWDEPLRLEPGFAGAFAAEQGTDGVIHVIFDRGTTRFSRQYVPGVGWEGSKLFDPDSYRTGIPVLRSGPDGRMVAVFTRRVGSGTQLFVTRYAPGAGWRAPERFDDSARSADSGDATIAADGTVTVIWRQYDANPDDMTVYARRWRVDGTWEAASALENAAGVQPDYLWPHHLRVVDDREGHTIALWSQDGTWSRYRVAGHGWSEAMQIAQSSPSAIDIVTDHRGVVVVGIGGSGWSQRFEHGVWVVVPPLPVEAEFESTRVAADASGAVNAAWRQHEYGTPDSLWVSRRGPGVAWEDPTPLAISDGPDISTPAIGADATGTRFVMWRKGYTYSGDMFVRRYAPGYGWLPTVTLEGSASTISNHNNRIVVAPDGTALAFWGTRAVDNSDLWVSVYR